MQMFSEKFGDTLLVLKNLLFLKIGTVLTLNNFWVWFSSIIFTYICFLAGDYLLQKLGFAGLTWRRRVVYAVPLGYGIFGLTGLILALLGLFSVWTLWAVVLLIAFLTRHQIFLNTRIFLLKNRSARAGRAAQGSENFVSSRVKGEQSEGRTDRDGGSLQGFRSNEKPGSLALLALSAVLVLWLLADFLIVLVPVTGHDTLDYHLPVMMSVIENQKITFSVSDRLDMAIPQFGEIIYAVPMAMFKNFSEPYIFQAMQFIFFLLFLLMFYDFFEPRLKNKFLAIAIPLSLMSITDFQREVMHGGYVDVVMYFYGFLGALIIIENISVNLPRVKIFRDLAQPDGASRAILQQENMRVNKNFAPEGNFNILILASIFFGIALGIKYNALFFIFIGFLILISFHLHSRKSLMEIFKILLLAFLIMFAIAGAWYAKNIYLYGNPVYPMYSVPQADANVNTYVMPVNFGNYFAFPFYRFSSWFVSDRASSGDLVILAFYIVLYPLIILNLFLLKKLASFEALLIIFFQIMTGFVFISSHQVRFMLPMMIIVPPLLVLLLDNIWEYIKIPERAAVALMGLVFIVMFLGSLHYFRNRYFYATGVYDVPRYVLEIGGL